MASLQLQEFPKPKIYKGVYKRYGLYEKTN